MSNPFNNNEESSLEKGISVTKPANSAVKAISAAAQQQAKAFTSDLLSQLYGRSDKSDDPSSMTDQQKQDAAAKQAQQAQKPAPKPVRTLGGMSDAGDHAKYAAMQKLLDQGDKKGADLAMHHMQYYYDLNVGTVDEQIKKAKQKREQEEQERAKKEQEEEERKKQELAEKQEALPQTTGKGRNKMGQPPNKKQKTPMAVQMGKNKAEMFRGSSG